MIPEWILVLALYIALVEIAYYALIREDIRDFFSEKFISMWAGLIGLFFAYGIPKMLSFAIIEEIKEPIGNIMFYWYYGIVLLILAFFGINYYITLKLQTKSKGGKK